MKGLCGADCANCEYGNNCGCKGCDSPFGKQCFIAKYIKIGGIEAYNAFKKKLIAEFNALNIEGMSEITELYALNGAYVNLEYSLPNGTKKKFLDDNEIYLGAQAECEFDTDNKCFGMVAGMDFLLVCTYKENGANPELVIFKKR